MFIDIVVLVVVIINNKAATTMTMTVRRSGVGFVVVAVDVDESSARHIKQSPTSTGQRQQLQQLQSSNQ
jgi:hypothetical protein